MSVVMFGDGTRITIHFPTHVVECRAERLIVPLSACVLQMNVTVWLRLCMPLGPNEAGIAVVSRKRSYAAPANNAGVTGPLA